MNLNLFTHTCYACNKRIFDSNQIFCLECQGELPKTNYQFSEDNPIKDKFRGLIPVHFSGAYLYYNKNVLVKELLNQIKYKNNTRLALEFGKIIGKELGEMMKSEIDFIVPIPLHSSKYQLRGYNQAELIGNGIAESSQIPILSDILLRKKNTTTQTKFTREKRFENLDEAFELKNTRLIHNKRILLLDDVITTGSTIASAGNVLLSNNIKHLSIFCLASAFEL